MADFVIFGIVVIALLAAVLVTVWLLGRIVTRMVAANNDLVVQSVVATVKGVLGGDGPAEVLPGNELESEPNEPYFPPWEVDELTFPGSADEIRGMEAGWAPSSTAGNPTSHPLPESDA